MSGEDYLLSLLHKKPELFHTESNYINQRPCPFLEYSKDRLTIKYLGKGLLYSDITSVQSVKPANHDTLIYYYEVKINNIGERGDISIGLADADFPLNKHPGWTKKSYGYKADGKAYNNKQANSRTLPKFTTGNCVGCGINYFKKEIFYTLNGEYQGSVFKDVELRDYHATISLHSLNECVTLNFGNKPFKFDVKKLVLDERRESVKSILKQPINHYSLHQIVHSYLNFHGYANTLEVFEKTAQIERKDVGLPRSEVFEDSNEDEDKKMEEDVQEGETLDSKLKRKKTTQETEMEIETKQVSSTIENRDHDHDKIEDNHVEMLDKEGRYRSESLRLEFESPIFTITRDQFPTHMEPFTLNSDNSNSNSRDFMLLRKASLYTDHNHNHATNAAEHRTANVGISLIQEQSNGTQNHFEAQANTYLLYERANLRQLILAGKIPEALSYISNTFPKLLQENEELLKTLHSQQFIEYIREKDHQKAILFAQKFLTPYQQEKICCLDNKGIVQEVPIDNMMALLCYPEPENSELKNFLSFEQRDLTADIINKGILGKMGFIDKSILDILIAQLSQTEEAYRENISHSSEVFKFEV